MSCQYTLIWTSFCRSEFLLFCSSRQMDAASFRQRASWRMSHGEHHCTLFCALDFYLHSKWERFMEGDAGTLHWTTRAVSSLFSAVCLAAASLLSSSSSEWRLLSLSSKDSLSSVESSAVLSLLSSASACPSFVSAKGERILALASRASPRSLVMFPSSRRRWTILWGCFKDRTR